jgi:hypothetical protein
MENGYSFHNMYYNFISTFTAPEHTPIYTRATPANDEIVSN